MYWESDLKIEMENEVKANEALKVVTEYLSQIDGKYNFINELYNDLVVKENTLIVEETSAFYEETFVILPELFKAIAQNDTCGKFNANLNFRSDYTCFYCDATFEKHTLTYHSEYFPEDDCYYCPDEDCYEFIANYEEFTENKTFTCPNCGKVYTADELAGERPEITDETWYIR